MPKVFETLRERLLVAGIAPRHVRRYLAELNDHLADLRAQGLDEATALARLGTLDDLAKPMVERPEFRSWIARWPGATFLLAPVAAMVAVFWAMFGVLLAIALPFEWPRGGVEPMWFQTLAQAAVVLQVFVAPILVGWAMSMLAVEHRLPVRWPLIGLTLFAFVAGALDLQVIFPKVAGDHGELRIGFGWVPPFRLGDDGPGKFALHGLVNLLLTAGPYLAWRRLRSNQQIGRNRYVLKA